MQIKNSAEGF